MSRHSLLSLGLVGLASVPLSHGASLPVKRDLSIVTLDGWQYLGCWSDSQASRTLSLEAHFGPHVSDDNCQYQCTHLGYNYAGVEYYGQCFCGNEVNSMATQEPETDCNLACTGQPTQPCGGANRLNLFWNGQNATLPPPMSTNPGVDNFKYMQCYTDSTGARTLAHEVNTAGGGSAMTVQLCVDACNSAGYSLAGVEFGGECYCDNAVENNGPASDQTICSKACNGNNTEYCGGAGAMNLYSKGGATVTSAAPVVNNGPALGSVTPNLTAGWTALGCYTDQTGKRALANEFNAAAGGMTVELCIQMCSANNYKLAGVEYGSECWCDNVFSNNQGSAPDGNAQCNMACAGNSGEICGGPSRLNAYAAGNQWVQLGCYTDNINSRTLQHQIQSDTLTVDSCLSSCSAMGYPYAGMEYGNECWCGSYVATGAGPAPDGFAGCSFTCGGNNNELCGGANRMSFYEFINANGTVSSIAAPAASAASTGGNNAGNAGGNTGGNAAQASSGPAIVTTGLAAGWSHQACYVDNTNGRILANQQPDSGSLTVEGCVTTCAGLGYTVAGVEYSSQCFCGNSIINGGVPTSDATKCNMGCSGNSSEACGGPGLMDIYATGTPSTISAPAPQTSNLPQGWSYTGCISDNVGARIFPHGTNFGNNKASTCLAWCAQNGYQYCGTEYSDECYGAMTAEFNPSAATTSTQCTMACAGDSNSICGGPGGLTYYTYTAQGGSGAGVSQ